MDQVPTKHKFRNEKQREFGSSVLVTWLLKEKDTVPHLKSCFSEFGISLDNIINDPWTASRSRVLQSKYALSVCASNTLKPRNYTSHPVIDAFLSLMSNMKQELYHLMQRSTVEMAEGLGLSLSCMKTVNKVICSTIIHTSTHLL